MSTVSVEWHGERAKDAVDDGSIEGLHLAGTHLLAESQLLVPYEEGELSRSGTASVDEDERVVTVSYNKPYAARQHEELTWKHDDDRQAKYLEQPFRTEVAVFRELIAASIRKRLAGQ